MIVTFWYTFPKCTVPLAHRFMISQTGNSAQTLTPVHGSAEKEHNTNGTGASDLSDTHLIHYAAGTTLLICLNAHFSGSDYEEKRDF